MCNNCSGFVRRADIVGEHIIPIEQQEYTTLEEYYTLMFDEDNVVPYCKTCAKTKTKKERSK